MKTEQRAEISVGICMAKGQPLSAHHLFDYHTYVSLGLSCSLSQESYGLSLGAFQTFLYFIVFSGIGIPSLHFTLQMCTAFLCHSIPNEHEIDMTSFDFCAICYK